MSKRNSKQNPGVTPPDAAGEQRPGEIFNNPFEALGRKLGSGGKADEKPAAGKTPAVTPSPAPGSGRGKAATERIAPQKNGPAKAFSAGPDPGDAALFLNAVNNPGFKPIRDEPGARRFAGKARTDIPSTRSVPVDGSGMAGPPANQAGTASAPISPVSPAQPAAPAPQVSKIASDPYPDSAEEELFAKAMQGVSPVDGKGRDLPMKAKPENRVQPGQPPAYLEDFLQGKFEFALEYTEEWFEGHVMGVDPLLIAKLRAGQYSAEAHIDLHGQNSEQAYDALVDFIRLAYNKGQRSLVVVTGRGKNSPGGLSVLRENMQEWLTQDPLKRVVLAFCTAQPKDGGAGALYVLLRKFKKSKGKIRWDRNRWGGVSLV